MLRQILAVFRGDTVLEAATADFGAMLELAQAMALRATEAFLGKTPTPEERTALYDQDVRMNKLERRVRKAVIAHLSGPVPGDVPYGLLLMSLVKDVERIGDYAKNLAELDKFSDATLTEDELHAELEEVRRVSDKVAREVPRTFTAADKERARELTLEGRRAMKRCDELLGRVSKTDYSAAQAVRFTLGARFLKRLIGHHMNVLSAVLMPLHKLDYYDEQVLEP